MAGRWQELEALLQAGVGEGVYTAAAAVVGLGGEVRWQGAAGRLTADPESPAVTPATVFDLASLTKPLATALSVLVLVQQRTLSLGQRLGELLPNAWLPREKRELTLVSLLTHRAGLPAWRPFYQKVLAAAPEQRSTLLELLAAGEPLTHPPETTTMYSDLGFMLLKAVVEETAGQDLDGFCRRTLYEPLGLAGLGFNPRRRPGGEGLEYAATEPGLIPGRPGMGEVHDENAWAAGGVAGHAGLFGTAGEVFALAAALYRSYLGEPGGRWPADLVRRFLAPAGPGLRALGFDLAQADPTARAAGRFFSEASVGHLGFTGTSFWMDPESGQLVVLLTNRVHLGRDRLEGIRAFRPRFHEAASQALGLA